MENIYYLKIINNNFGFIPEGEQEIKETDIVISGKDYDNFFKLQSEGKQFKLKERPTGRDLFDYIEEYTPKKTIQESGQDEFNLDIEYRLSKIELGV